LRWWCKIPDDDNMMEVDATVGEKAVVTTHWEVACNRYVMTIIARQRWPWLLSEDRILDFMLLVYTLAVDVRRPIDRWHQPSSSLMKNEDTASCCWWIESTNIRKKSNSRDWRRREMMMAQKNEERTMTHCLYPRLVKRWVKWVVNVLTLKGNRVLHN
jgi:hypothetical protein